MRIIHLLLVCFSVNILIAQGNDPVKANLSLKVDVKTIQKPVEKVFVSYYNCFSPQLNRT
jgi:hypothetical protein